MDRLCQFRVQFASGNASGSIGMWLAWARVLVIVDCLGRWKRGLKHVDGCSCNGTRFATGVLGILSQHSSGVILSMQSIIQIFIYNNFNIINTLFTPWAFRAFRKAPLC